MSESVKGPLRQPLQNSARSSKTATPSETQTSLAVNVRPVMYSQLAVSARPIDRIRRPAPKAIDQSALTGLIKDLTFSVDTAAEPAKTKPAKKRLVPDQQASLFTDNNAEVAPKLSKTLKPQASNQTQSKRIYKNKFVVILMLLLIMAGSMALGSLLAKRYFIHTSQAPSVQSEQDDADWKRAQAQWQCTLQQYQAKQSNKQVKESSCVKQ